MHFTPISPDSFRTKYSNIRIEQLRKGGANIYVNAENSVLSFSMKELSLSDNTKGFKIDGNSSCKIYLSNIICFNSNAFDLFDINNPNATLLCSKFTVNPVNKFDNAVGVNITPLNLYSLPNTFIVSTDNQTEQNYNANTLTVERNFISISRPVYMLDKTYTASVLYSKLFNQNSIVLNVNVYAEDVISTLKVLLHIEDGKFTKLLVVEDKFNLSRYITLSINADYYVDINKSSSVGTLLYNF